MINPYQSPFPDEFLDEKVRGYEAAIGAHERTIVGLRDRVRELEAENDLLRYYLESPAAVFGFQMESADI